MKIKNIKKITYEDEVYNLHIKNNHNYFANGICASNCHGTKAAVIRSVIEKSYNAWWRIGCTGTLPDGKADKMLIEGALGPVLHKVTTKDIIEAGMASDLTIKIPYIFYPKEVAAQLKGLPFDEEKKFMESYEPRNKIIRNIAKKHCERDHNCLALVDHIEHAEFIFEKMKEIDGAEAFLVTGATDPEERERIRKYVNTNKKCIIVATYGVFSTGVSINRLHAVIFGSSGKSKIKTLQSIGRGLRLHSEKFHMFVYDIGDDLTYSKKHLQARLDMYTKAEFGIDIKELRLDQ